jgi:hypothetical protein
LDVAADLSLFAFNQCANTDFVNSPLTRSIRQEWEELPFSEAAKALEALLCGNPQHFLSNKAIAALGCKWISSLLSWCLSALSMGVTIIAKLCGLLCLMFLFGFVITSGVGSNLYGMQSKWQSH